MLSHNDLDSTWNIYDFEVGETFLSKELRFVIGKWARLLT